ncbi:MAG: zinc-ribbon and FHA domain-containing protein [Actinomycetota bacterium]|nr:zinc-ribbon and FHA domain-containing protein [Actinomycetota bacterium]
MTDVFCTNCGHRNSAPARFCSSCGATLEADSGEETTITFAPVDATGEVLDEDVALAIGELADSTAMVVVKRGPNAGSKFVLENEVTKAGRHPDSDIFLDDITVSRRHAEIHRGAESYSVRDAGSLNGTYLNRERIDEAPLANGDELQIGKFRLVFFAGGTGEE